MSFPNLAFWSNLLGTVGIEVCVVVALGVAAQCAFRRAYWQRAMWQMTLICLILVSASEWTGLGRGTVWYLLGRERATARVVALPSQTIRIDALPVIRPWVSNNPPVPLRPEIWWPVWVWLAGMVIVLGRMATAQCLLLVLRFRREKIVDNILQERVTRIAKMVGLHRKVCLLRLPESISPMAFGILFPTIGLPPGFETGFSPVEQDAILAHELAHLAVLDPLWFRLADFASALLWWHPLAWWARRSLHGTSELAADEATALVADGPGSLANCLVGLGKKMTLGHGWGWVGINGEFRSKLGKRVERLTRMSGNAGRPFVSWTDTVTRIAVAILIAPSAVLLLFAAFQTAHGERENGWRESWNSSPGGLLAMAALDEADKQPDKVPIATRIMDAKLLFEMGKLEEAKAILTQVMKDDPSNKTAPYFLNLIKEAEFRDRARKREAVAKSAILDVEGDHLMIPNPSLPSVTNGLVYTSQGRQAILSKLDRIRLNEVRYDLPLTEVLNRLRIESQKRDPDGVGINFLFNPHLDAAPGASSSRFITGPAPAGAVPITAPVPFVDMSTVNIKISPALKDIRLVDVLNAITMVADQPIKYTVEDYAVVFSPKPVEAITLYSKVFHLDPNTFIKSILAVSGTNSENSAPDTDKPTDGKPADDGPRRDDDGHDSFGGPASSSSQVGLNFVRRTNDTVRSDQIVRAYFAGAGVDMTEPGKSIFFNDRLGLLLVRATAQDLQLIETAIAALNQSPPQAITLYSKAFHVDPRLFVMNLLKAFRTNSATETSSGGTESDIDNDLRLLGEGHDLQAERTNEIIKLDSMFRAYLTASGVDLSEPGKSVFFNDRLGLVLVRASAQDLEITGKVVDLLLHVPPQVTIESKFTELSPQDAKALGFEKFLDANESNLTSIMTDVEFRAAIKSIEQNPHSDVLAAPKVTTLSGRQAQIASTNASGDGPALNIVATVGPDGFSIRTVAIASVKNGNQIWSATVTRELWDGQTLVIGQMVSVKPSAPRVMRLVFVTPTIIDPAGNRIHSDEELSEKH